ncbi:PEP-CTERM sorting domain-containing protein [Rhodopirellula sallentina]|uniref:PEP-CTERM bacterial domain protein n=1 Tax=Rhodopirellula sallentina SM41 TaxID=1263870 RepID=M5TZC6_9BACT|nr:PEP-CTERM sorting domain-containing protein [Rhodopirellula sallentina]EMI54379.1 PEP-CTERM bacterial domain protein [Rhodopirellula sallentina SM41]
MAAITLPANAAVFTQIADPFVRVDVDGSPGLDSQFDLGATGTELPNYATVYDDFLFANDSVVTNFSWIGSYELDEEGDVLASEFMVSVYANETTGPFSNEPSDTPIYTETISSSALGEEQFFIGDRAFRSYSADITGLLELTGGETYWFSVVAQLDWADNNWGFAFSDLGNGNSFQDFQDDVDVEELVRHNDTYDYAFSVTAVPEPGAFAVIGLTGLLAVAYRGRRRNVVVGVV